MPLMFYQNSLSFCIPDFISFKCLPSSVDGMVVNVWICIENQTYLKYQPKRPSQSLGWKYERENKFIFLG